MPCSRSSRLVYLSLENNNYLLRSGGPVTQQPHGIVRRQSQRKVQNSRVSSKTRQTYGVSKKKTKAASRSGARRRGHSSSKQNIGRNQQHKLQPQSKSGLRPAASKRSKSKIGNEEIQDMIKNFEQGLEVQRLRKALEMSMQSKQDSEQFIEASRGWFS